MRETPWNDQPAIGTGWADAAAAHGRRVPAWVARLVIWATASFAVATAHLPLMGWSALGRFTDERAYLAIMQGGFVISSPFRYRVVVPWLARLVPQSLVAHLSSAGTAAADWSGAARFAVVNFILLTALGALFHRYLRRLGFAERHAIGGTLLLYVMRPVIQNGGLPSVDPGAWLCLVAALLIAIDGRVWWLVPLFLVGMFVKETLLLALPLIATTSHSPRRRTAQLAATLPGIVLYFAVRWVIAPPHNERYYSLWRNLAHPMNLVGNAVHLVSSPERLLEVFSAFAFAWLLFAVGIARGGFAVVPRRWRWFLPLVLALIILLSLDVGRVLFLAFPIVLPLSLWALVTRGATRTTVEVRRPGT